MRYITIQAVLILFLLILQQAAAQEEKEEQIECILTQIEEINRFSEMYRSTTKIASFSPNSDPLLTSFTTYSKGIDRILVQYVSPKKDKGKKILFRDDKIWMYFPKAKKSIVMNPVNTLFGTVAIGDIIGPPVLELYTLESAGRIKAGNEAVYELIFTAKSITSPYGSVLYRYEGDRIVYSECYTRSGILLKRAYFSDFTNNERGYAYATRIKMESAVNTEYYSLIQISELENLEDIPDYYFHPESLSLIELR